MSSSKTPQVPSSALQPSGNDERKGSNEINSALTLDAPSVDVIIRLTVPHLGSLKFRQAHRKNQR